jgi:hypothetical protein
MLQISQKPKTSEKSDCRNHSLVGIKKYILSTVGLHISLMFCDTNLKFSQPFPLAILTLPLEGSG